MKNKRTNEGRWLIWSIEHEAWWKANRSGYTIYRDTAGLYSFKEATMIVEAANAFMGDTPNEAMIKYVS